MPTNLKPNSKLTSLKIQTHRDNIDRLWRLLSDDLTPKERDVLHMRIIEQQTALERLEASENVDPASSLERVRTALLE